MPLRSPLLFTFWCWAHKSVLRAYVWFSYCLHVATRSIRTEQKQ